jgi:hypothetical protein
MSSPREEDKPFSGTEVGALIESFRGDISIMAECLDTVAMDVTVLKNDVKDLKADMAVVKDVIRITIPQINSRLSALEMKFH